MALDTDRFLREREPLWHELEAKLRVADTHGVRHLGLDGARAFAKLYRQVSADLVRARTAGIDAAVQDYLNALVARAYAHVYGAPGRSLGGESFLRAVRFFVVLVPALVRAELRLVLLAAALFVGGGAVGALATAWDPDSMTVFIPEQHQAWTPDERVTSDEGEAHTFDEAAPFASFLFTHNIQVAFTAFALGMTFGVGTVAVLFYNGVPLGALAVQYHLAGRGLFFWAWILPHGIPEITAVVLAGAAGLVLARGLVTPGRRSRREALVAEGRRAVRLVAGTIPILVVAGLIEGSISQMHPPQVAYGVKLAFAGLVGVALLAWLTFAGRGVTEAELDA